MYIAYRDGRGDRGWSVIKEDDTQDGLLVGSGLTQEYAEKIAGLLNKDQEKGV